MEFELESPNDDQTIECMLMALIIAETNINDMLITAEGRMSPFKLNKDSFEQPEAYEFMIRTRNLLLLQKGALKKLREELENCCSHLLTPEAYEGSCKELIGWECKQDEYPFGGLGNDSNSF